MVELYVKLIKAGRRTIYQVPEQNREQGKKELENKGAEE